MPRSHKAVWLKGLSLAMGGACGAIGIVHFVLGSRSVPGEEHAGATVDSRERFYGAIFLGYGLGWLEAARQAPISARTVRLLTGVFALGAVGRGISVVDRGWPHAFQTVLTGIEIALPPVLFWMADADELSAAQAGRA